MCANKKPFEDVAGASSGTPPVRSLMIWEFEERTCREPSGLGCVDKGGKGEAGEEDLSEGQTL